MGTAVLPALQGHFIAETSSSMESGSLDGLLPGRLQALDRYWSERTALISTHHHRELQAAQSAVEQVSGLKHSVNRPIGSLHACVHDESTFRGRCRCTPTLIWRGLVHATGASQHGLCCCLIAFYRQLVGAACHKNRVSQPSRPLPQVIAQQSKLSAIAQQERAGRAEALLQLEQLRTEKEAAQQANDSIWQHLAEVTAWCRQRR